MTHMHIERLRPAAIQSVPVMLDEVFDDPDAVMRFVEDNSPYLNLAEFHNMEDTLGGANTQPRYRAQFDDPMLLDNPTWIDAARKSFGARIVRPFRCVLNLNGPMGPGGVHVDLPVYRGFAGHNAPVWLLMNMTYSGLFQDWMVPIASGLAWFYRGEGGPFAYWPDGTDKPPLREYPPMWNTGVVSDNEYMWHGVGATGSEADRAALRGKVDHRDRLHHAGSGRWDIRGPNGTAARLAPDQLRISLLWKAYVFIDEDHLASFERPEMDLDADIVADIYLRDLTHRGIKAVRPADPLTDPEWRATLHDAYPPPFSEAAAGDYS